jgi:hypothetical protein
LRRVLAGFEAGRVGKAEQKEFAQAVVVDAVLARLPDRRLIGLQQALVVDAVHRNAVEALVQVLLQRLQQREVVVLLGFSHPVHGEQGHLGHVVLPRTPARDCPTENSRPASCDGWMCPPHDEAASYMATAAAPMRRCGTRS